jgi:DNA-binding XRE family transcriptional regulator
MSEYRDYHDRCTVSMTLKDERFERKLRQSDVAEEIGISPTSYHRKENNPEQFTKREIDGILELFEKEYEEIFEA